MLKVDLHLHSNGSPDSRTTLDQLIERAAEAGLDRIALTDHNTAEGAIKLKGIAPQLAIVGEEVRTTEGEIIGLFIERSIPARLSPERVCDLIHEMGGLTYFPHPLDRFRANFAAHRLVELADRIDIIEVYNPWARPQDNQAAAHLCAELGKVAAAGSDSHGTEELGQSWMEMEEYSGPADFLAKLAGARHVVTAQSGTRRRA